MSDFPPSTIEIRPTTDNWGPFNFNMAPRIPSGDSIASFTTAAYVGEVLPTATLSDYTEMSASLVESNPAPASTASILSVYLKHPGNTYTGESITLVFHVTFTTKTGVHPFHFYRVLIQGGT